MENENVIAWVYVIVKPNGYVDPTIYLTRPDESPEYKIHMHFNPFDAKKFIIENMTESIEIEVRKNAA